MEINVGLNTAMEIWRPGEEAVEVQFLEEGYGHICTMQIPGAHRGFADLPGREKGRSALILGGPEK